MARRRGMVQVMRIGLAGVGRIGAFHASTLAGLDAVDELVARRGEDVVFFDGRNAHVRDGVRRALGREPRDFADYARATAASGAWTVERVA